MANSTVRPRDAISRIVVQKAWRASTSSATVGSSSTSRSGFETSAIAKRARCVCPPDSFSVRRLANDVMPVSSSTSSTGSGSG